MGPLVLGMLRNEKFWMVVGAAAILGFAWLWVLDYGQRRYEAGVASERAVWEEAVRAAQEERDQAETALAELRAAREADSNERVVYRDRIVRETQEGIANAEDTAERLAVLDSFNERLRLERAERRSQVRADYLSSIADDGSR